VNIGRIAYFGVEWSVVASGDPKNGEDVCSDQMRWLKSKRIEKMRREAEGGGSLRKRRAEFEIATFEYNMSKQQLP
jgi:hypothetical protein